MAQSGTETSFYAQQALINQIDQAVLKYPGVFSSRSHFINCAIARELRRLQDQPPELEIE